MIAASQEKIKHLFGSFKKGDHQDILTGGEIRSSSIAPVAAQRQEMAEERSRKI